MVAAGWPPTGPDHPGALLAQVTEGGVLGEQGVVAGEGEGGAVVGLARNRCGDRGQAAGQVGEDLHVEAGLVALPDPIGTRVPSTSTTRPRSASGSGGRCG